MTYLAVFSSSSAIEIIVYYKSLKTWDSYRWIRMLHERVFIRAYHRFEVLTIERVFSVCRAQGVTPMKTSAID